MTISIPLIAIVAVIVWVAWRYMGLRTWQALICLLAGFLLAATSAAPPLRHIIRTILHALTGH
jgi:hypothetical protein